ncbi:MAG: LysM peptidoglycan-binding domain-containing protein [Firmicutes bacterium]|nr:LysM peptidoglycan-binding domain-containing protein [Bacillota bacterium]
MKHYHIANRMRFVCFVAMVLLAVSFVIMGIINTSSAKEKRDMRYTEVTVREGDTLWELALDHGNPEKDVREVVYDICLANNIKAGDIRPGQILMIPEE